jgi:hypothetical protein
MEQYFFGADSDLQLIKECIKHGKPCKYYQRSNEQALCEDCKTDIERRIRTRQTDSQDSISNPNMMGGVGNSMISGVGQSMIQLKDKGGILPVKYYAEEFFNSIKKKYEEMVEVFKKHETSVMKKQNHFKRESHIMFTRI